MGLELNFFTTLQIIYKDYLKVGVFDCVRVCVKKDMKITDEEYWKGRRINFTITIYPLEEGEIVNS